MSRVELATNLSTLTRSRLNPFHHSSFEMPSPEQDVYTDQPPSTLNQLYKVGPHAEYSVLPLSFAILSQAPHSAVKMKSWFHSHRLRKSRSGKQSPSGNEAFLPWLEALLPLQQYESSEVEDAMPEVVTNRMVNASRIAISKTSSRMSIERYLSAPLEDEPASVPAINAALKKQTSQSRVFHVPPAIRGGHSRETSLDANSDGRRTFYTSGSAPESSGTSYSAVSKTNRSVTHHQRSKTLSDVPELPKPESLYHDPTMVASPERPTTSGTVEVDVEKTWAGQMSRFMPGYSPDKRIDYKAKVEEELARIQEKARQLQEQMLQYQEESRRQEPAPVRVTDEMAYAQMAARPKLAWILGGDVSDAKSIERPKSSRASSTDDLPDRRPSTSSAVVSNFPGVIPRRTKSSSALDEGARQAALEKRAAGALERKPSKRLKFHCTFCSKRFYSPQEWMRHERIIHMPEELWVCCPRIGKWPDRCPFCAKHNPSPSHLADHNYLSCQEKPLSERTFSSKDHFLQHISQVHKVSPGQKPLRLTELLDMWRHVLPLKQGHQALHCGFCGKVFSTYKERTEHVKWHFMQGLDMMSWWSARVSHEISPPKLSEFMFANAYGSTWYGLGSLAD